MVNEWYYERDGQRHGPFSAGQLRQLAADGRLQTHHLLWKEGMQKKVPARSVKGLFSAVPATTGTAVKPAASNPPAGKGGTAGGSQVAEEALEAELVEEDEEAFEVVEEVEAVEAVEEVETVEAIEEVEAVEEEPEGRAPEKTPDRDKPRPQKQSRKQPESEILTEASVTYRKGLPGCDGPRVGTLYVETTRLRFEFEDEEFPISFERVLDAMAPTEGDHPPGSWSKAMGTKMAGKMGKIASGMLGSAVGGIFGNAAKKAGEEVSGMVEKGGELGKPPINRIVLLVLRREKRCRVYFDVNGEDRREMNQEAQFLFQTLQKARSKVAAPESEEGAEIGFLKEGSTPGGTAPEGGTAGQRFRVLRDGKILGTYSFEELRRLRSSDKLKATDLIGIEAWIPVSSLGGLLLTESTSGLSAKGSASDEGQEEAKGEQKEARGKKAKEDDEGPIPVDEEFKM
jgi:hypothetical protein